MTVRFAPLRILLFLFGLVLLPTGLSAQCPYYQMHNCGSIGPGPTQRWYEVMNAMGAKFISQDDQTCLDANDRLNDWLANSPLWEFGYHDNDDPFFGPVTGVSLYFGNPPNRTYTDIGARSSRFGDPLSLRNTLFHEIGHVIYDSEFMAQVIEDC